MKKWLSLVLLFLPLIVFAQGQQASLSNPLGGDIIATSSNCSVVLSCVWQKLPAPTTTVTVTVSGTFSATLQFEQSGDGVNFVSASPASTTTTGTTTFTVTSLTDFRVRASAYTSGKASVNIQASGNQTNITIGSGVTQVSALPLTCTPGGSNNLVFLTVAPIGEYRCIATNTFAPAYSKNIDAVSYGVVANGVVLMDATFGNASSNITSPSANFQCPGAIYPCSTVAAGSDVGKKIWALQGAFTGSDLAIILPEGTITTVTDATHIVVSSTSTAATISFATLIYGTPDDAALDAAWTATYKAAGSLQLPSGFMIVERCHFFQYGLLSQPFSKNNGEINFPNISGPPGGQYNSFLVPSPNMDLTGGGTPNTQAKTCFSSGSTQVVYSNFGIWGGGLPIVSNPSLEILTNVDAVNFQLTGWGSGATNVVGDSIGSAAGAAGFWVNSFNDGAGNVPFDVLGGEAVGTFYLINDSFVGGGSPSVHVHNNARFVTAQDFIRGLITVDRGGFLDSSSDSYFLGGNSINISGQARIANGRFNVAAISVLGGGFLSAHDNNFFGATGGITTAVGSVFQDGGNNTFLGGTGLTLNGTTTGTGSITGLTATPAQLGMTNWGVAWTAAFYGFGIGSVEASLSGGGKFTTITGINAPKVVNDGNKNLCEPSTIGGASGSFYSGVAWPNDQSSSVTISALQDLSPFIVPVVRQSGAANTNYQLDITSGVNATQTIFKVVAGTATSLTTFTATAAVGDTWTLKVIGTTLTAFQNGVSKGTITDASIASGSPGFELSSSTGPSSASISYWSGQAEFAAAPITAVSGASKLMQFTINATGTPAANPTVVVNFPVPFFAGTTPVVRLVQVAGTNFTDVTNPVASAISNTGATFTFSGTPVAARNYTFQVTADLP